MTKPLTIGLVVPFSTDKVPEEGPMMYPGVKFIPRAVGVRALTPEGYDAAWNGILPAAKQLAKEGGNRVSDLLENVGFCTGKRPVVGKALQPLDFKESQPPQRSIPPDPILTAGTGHCSRGKIQIGNERPLSVTPVSAGSCWFRDASTLEAGSIGEFGQLWSQGRRGEHMVCLIHISRLDEELTQRAPG